MRPVIIRQMESISDVVRESDPAAIFIALRDFRRTRHNASPDFPESDGPLDKLARLNHFFISLISSDCRFVVAEPIPAGEDKADKENDSDDKHVAPGSLS